MRNRVLIVICAAVVVLLGCYGMVLAQATESNVTQSATQVVEQVRALPDLLISTVTLNPLPKENGTLDSIKIVVKNQGDADATECVLNLNCLVAECFLGVKCADVSRLVKGDIAVPALKKGEMTELIWKPDSQITWVSGKYSLVAEIDKYGVVTESNEANNVAKCMIYATSFMPKTSAEEEKK